MLHQTDVKIKSSHLASLNKTLQQVDIKAKVCIVTYLISPCSVPTPTPRSHSFWATYFSFLGSLTPATKAFLKTSRLVPLSPKTLHLMFPVPGTLFSKNRDSAFLLLQIPRVIEAFQVTIPKNSILLLCWRHNLEFRLAMKIMYHTIYFPNVPFLIVLCLTPPWG